MKVFLCGEGSNELGSRSGHRSYQMDERPGVLHALLARVQAAGREVGGARDWASIRKYKTGGAARRDTHNVLSVALDAKEAECDVLAFSRDLDKEATRKDAIEEGIRRVPEAFAGAPEVDALLREAVALPLTSARSASPSARPARPAAATARPARGHRRSAAAGTLVLCFAYPPTGRGRTRGAATS